MNGVAVARTHFPAHAYCLGTEGGEDGGPCPFDREAAAEDLTDMEVLAGLLAEVQDHVRKPGHTVWVDVVDRTVFEAAPEPAAVSA